jgi:predicted transcriptional regulator
VVRTKLQIIFQILTLCQVGTSKTKIVIQANMNYKSVKPYLDMLAPKDLIKLEREFPTTYITTDKGNQLMHKLKNTIHVLE